MKRRTLFLSGLVLLVVIAAGAAFAYWTSHGSGSGTSAAGTIKAVTVVTATGTPTTPLLPGSSADVTLTVNNTNSFPVTLVTVTGGPAAIKPSGGTGCNTDNSNSGVTFNNRSNLSISLPAGTSTVDLSGAASMSTSSSTGCQGATFTIPVTMTVQTP